MVVKKAKKDEWACSLQSHGVCYWQESGKRADVLKLAMEQMENADNAERDHIEIRLTRLVNR